MSWSYDPSGWTGATKPTVTDFQNIAADLHTRGAVVDGGAYGRANTGYITLVSGDLPGRAYTVTGASWAASVATLTIGAHNIKVGQIVQVSSVLPTGYNGTVITTAVTGTTISYALASNPGTYTSGGSVLVSGSAAADGMLAVDQSGNLNFRKSGTFSVIGGLGDPGSNGIVKRTALNVTGIATAGTDFVAPLTSPTAWTALSGLLTNSWVDLGSGFAVSAYMIDALGFVHLRGNIHSGTATDGTVLFVLPAGFRPPANIYIPAMAGAGGNLAFCFLGVDTSGNVTVHAAIGNANLSLSGCNFSTLT